MENIVVTSKGRINNKDLKKDFEKSTTVVGEKELLITQKGTFKGA